MVVAIRYSIYEPNKRFARTVTGSIRWAYLVLAKKTSARSRLYEHRNATNTKGIWSAISSSFSECKIRNLSFFTQIYRGSHSASPHNLSIFWPLELLTTDSGGGGAPRETKSSEEIFHDSADLRFGERGESSSMDNVISVQVFRCGGCWGWKSERLTAWKVIIGQWLVYRFPLQCGGHLLKRHSAWQCGFVDSTLEASVY